jgi:tetratricopeptide (TPR) repeat protein
MWRRQEARAGCRFIPGVALWLAAGVLVPASVARADIATLDQPADSGEIDAIVERNTELIAARPGQARLYLARAHAYFKRREFESAVRDYTQALKMDDRLDDAYFGRGMALGRAGSVAEGIADLTTYLKRHPRSSLAYTKRGIRHLWNGDVESAEKDFRAAINLDPANAEAHDDLGVILAQRQEYEAAARHFRATIAADRSYQKGYHNLAMVQFIQGRHREALQIVDQALQLHSAARDTLMLKGLILQALGRNAEAKPVIEKAELLPKADRSERYPVR